MRRLRNQEQAEDAVQETLLAALEGIDRFGGGSSLGTGLPASSSTSSSTRCGHRPKTSRWTTMTICRTTTTLKASLRAAGCSTPWTRGSSSLVLRRAGIHPARGDRNGNGGSLRGARHQLVELLGHAPSREDAVARLPANPQPRRRCALKISRASTRPTCYAFWLARDRSQAEDIVQEALLHGWRAYPRLRVQGAAKSWLFSIVRNEYLRAAELSPAREPGGTRSARRALAGARAGDARGARGAACVLRRPLALQVLGGFSCAEIAAMLGTTEGATMTRLTRARQALRRLIAPAKERRGGRA